MIDHRATVKRILISALFFLLLSVGNKLSAQDGKVIFQNTCASCHSVFKDLTGPALGGVTSRGPWTDRKKLYEWVHNPSKFMTTDPYTQGLKQKFGITMTAFDGLSTKEIDAVIDYVEKTFKAGPPTTGGTPSSAAGGQVMDEKDNSILYGVLTLILAVVALIMLQVNSNLKKLADDKDGLPAYEPIPFYRNKSYITLLVLVLFVIGGFYIVKGAIGLGRSQNYQPEQPIFYSHKVHAGVNQINCLYCHGGAMEGKHANIPSVNICMNCHMTINEYTGTAGKLFREDGTEVNGTDEIKKIYAAAGWDASKKQYTGETHEIAWTKIHNLPDHVYFNHSQHVNAGKVQCQTCHGEITKMDEVYQFADLSMGWCINCHRTTKVNFGGKNGEDGNKFYSIYKKYHDEIKEGKRDSVTVNDIGGTECQKCHY
ncbi:cytochrome C [Niastella koreensis]|uniref:Quinol:cytochrome c oxidoreductase pentaheme cytochrome subunit n=2 Tax=Niastella koreensis TaxID=354356 RepID=G8TF72_NIAKG|nr:c-type cytochrome [Niastella koreensis]AEW02692.1 quinol:cytochrome c oxidoreductase pentaheme cytochrome subunit [Niastella koreensis GR20-10]OQP55040.1 cytochrome C [Niastella koreensis]